jgi:2'-5' RNA ligase
MRIFIGINFSKSVKNELSVVSDELKRISKKGRIIPRDNMHITMAFIGEVTEGDLGLIIDAIEDTHIKEFEIYTDGMDLFKGKRGAVCYLKFKENKDILELNHRLKNQLSIRGINFDKKSFIPHITIGRDILVDYEELLKLNFDSLRIKVSCINLMETININGKLQYKILY